MSAIRIGVCDDNAEDRKRIGVEVRKVVTRLIKGTDVEIRMYSNGLALVESNQRESFQLIFLDIEMPGSDGFEVARRLSIGRVCPELVFVSNYENMVFDSQEYRPLWFVRKRLLEEDVKKAVAKYLEIRPERKLNFKVKSRMGCWEIRYADILYVECRGHEITVVMKNKETCVGWGSLKAMEDELDPDQFLRIHSNFLVNMDYVKEIGKRDAELVGGIWLPVAKDRRKEAREAIRDYERKNYGIR